MEERAFVIVYKGLGHQSLRIPSVGLSVFRLVQYLEHHSDWLWGVGNSFKLTCKDSGEAIGWNYSFPEDRSCELRLIYLAYRVTTEGFPCWFCWKWVPWGRILWYTRYIKVPQHMFQHGLFNCWDRHRWNYLYHPREFFCADCGPKANGLYNLVEEVHTDPVTCRVKVYTRP